METGEVLLCCVCLKRPVTKKCAKTCSPECSDKLKRVHQNEAWERIKEQAAAQGISAWEYRRRMKERNADLPENRYPECITCACYNEYKRKCEIFTHLQQNCKSLALARKHKAEGRQEGIYGIIPLPEELNTYQEYRRKAA